MAWPALKIVLKTSEVERRESGRLRWLEALFLEIAGWLVIRVRVGGSDPAAFLDLCSRKGIVLWDVRIGDGFIHCCLALRDLKNLLQLRKDTRFTFKILRRNGLPFLIRRIRTRPGFAAGAVLFGMALYVWSQIVWSVEVSGAERLDAARVLQTAKEAGLRRGALKGRLDLDAIAEAIVERHEEIAWATVRMRGNRALVEVVLKAGPPERPPELIGHDLVAGKAGLIVSAVTLHGQPAVKPGDVVAPGDILIAWSENSPSARGAVLARTWYERESFCPLRRQVTRRTGARVVRTSVFWRGREVLAMGPRTPPYREYEAEESVAEGMWRKAAPAVEVRFTTFHEVVTWEEPLNYERAKAVALNEALAELRKCMPPEAERVCILGEVVRASEDGVTARVVVESLEDIGVAIPRKVP